ncbi:TniB family NTP-binding protein [Bacillus cereus]|uniref:TniB family NTP-binding protein n=1 Tax=Bacillus cereus TaxID=1396 RepID=UPI0024BC8B5C|nr:TniB family NTP-binding protein [Bacillus cereus]
MRSLVENMLYTGKQTLEEKLNKFKRVKIIHPKMNQVMSELKSLIEKPSGNEIIMVLGPSGVGKSTLIEEFKKEIINNLFDELEKERSILPFVSIELISPDSGVFNWKDFYVRVLRAMEEPLIEKKVIYENNSEPKKRDKISVGQGHYLTSPALRRSLENAFYYRKPKVFIVDEAQHFIKVPSARKYLDQLDSLKSLSNLTKVPQLLVGTYELKNFVNLNGQLARRTFEIHFPRYDISNEQDFINYLGVIKGLFEYLPIETSPSLLEKWDYLYERTVGCVGILKDWLTRALRLALENNEKSLKMQHLRNTALPINKVSKLVDELSQGEACFIENSDRILDVRIKLGLDNENVNQRWNSKKKNVGIRNPKRDKVGEMKNE